MNTLLINNRRYTCELWELMSWDKLHAILRYDEQRRRSDRQSVDRLTAELLTKIAGVRRRWHTVPTRTTGYSSRSASSRIFPTSCGDSKTCYPTRHEAPGKGEPEQPFAARGRNGLGRKPDTDVPDNGFGLVPGLGPLFTRQMAVRAADRGPALAGSGKRLRPKSPPQGRSSETETASIFRSLLRPNRTGPPAVPQSLSALLLQAVAPAGHDTEQSTWCDLLAWTGHYVAGEIERTGQMKCPDFMDLVHSRLKIARIAQSNARLRTGPLSRIARQGKVRQRGNARIQAANASIRTAERFGNQTAAPFLSESPETRSSLGTGSAPRSAPFERDTLSNASRPCKRDRIGPAIRTRRT